MAKVSIIVPVYNPPEKYLKKCLNSIINQTFQDTEIILIDNESTSNNPSILKEYGKKDPRIKLIVFKKNKGFAGAVNAGLKTSVGDFILIIDSDDWLENNAIQVLHDKLNNSDLDMTIYCARTFDAKFQIFTDNVAFTFPEISETYNNSSFQFKDVKDCILHCPTQAWNKFYRKSFLIDNNNFVDEELGSAGADALFTFYNYVNAQKIGIIRDKLYNYRVNVEHGVVSTLRTKNCQDFMFSFKLFDKINRLIVDKKMPSEIALPFAKLNIQQLMCFFRMIHSHNKPQYYKKLRECLCSLATDIYTEDCFQALKTYNRMDYDDIIKIQHSKTYRAYQLKQFIYKKKYIPEKNVVKHKICNITFYKQHFE